MSQSGRRTTIHLVRHGKVENPMGVIYGRLPGYHLSELGKQQARAAAEHLNGARIGALWSSPMERAQETAAIINESHGLAIVTDERLTESHNSFEGVRRTWRGIVLGHPLRWWHLRNPLRPSWGETFTQVKERMLEAIWQAAEDAADAELVVVSHQTPVLVARLALSKRRVPPWLAFTPCHTGSVTTLEMDANRHLVRASYFKPPDVLQPAAD
jgi:broad specificity phosphatase PhoE